MREECQRKYELDSYKKNCLLRVISKSLFNYIINKFDDLVEDFYMWLLIKILHGSNVTLKLLKDKTIGLTTFCLSAKSLHEWNVTGSVTSTCWDAKVPRAIINDGATSSEKGIASWTGVYLLLFHIS